VDVEGADVVVPHDPVHACCNTLVEGSGHGCPPFAAAISTERVAYITPEVPPQVTSEHTPNAVQLLITQF